MIFFNQNRLLYIFFVILLLSDLCFSYCQYSHTRLDGDFSPIVLPDNGYAKVLNDPLGLSALKGEKYGAPNRFTAHYIMSEHFKKTPLFLQNYLAPIDSLYASITFTKLFIHIALLFLLSYFVSGWSQFKWKYIIIAALLISPLFHAESDYIEYFSVINRSITYAMFYPLPMIFTLLFFLPFYRYFFTNKITHSPFFIFIWLIFVLFLVFFGALPAPILLISIAILIYVSLRFNFQKERLTLKIIKPDKTIIIIFMVAGFCSLYSLYIGTNNIENEWWPMSLSDRFALLPTGLLNTFNSMSVLLIAITSNLVILYLSDRIKHKDFLKLVFFLFVFCCIYILLIPIGGYRAYRPYILRADVLLPVLLVLFYIWASSSIFLLSHFRMLKKWLYTIFIVSISGFYTLKDRLPETNLCEKERILAIAHSKQYCTSFSNSCSIMDWGFHKDCEHSKNNCTLLKYYNILPQEKRYNHPDGE